jgi:hypothetical protein
MQELGAQLYHDDLMSQGDVHYLSKHHNGQRLWKITFGKAQSARYNFPSHLEEGVEESYLESAWQGMDMQL